MPDTTVERQRTALRDWHARHRPDEPVRLVETHISILALGPERVWKLKKAVHFPFIDLSTRALRHRDCEREVELNRRLAPDVYLGVTTLDDASGAYVDSLVEMRRMPDDRRLGNLASGGADVAPCIDTVARLIAGFHRRAPTGGTIDACATVGFVRGLWNASIDELAASAPDPVDHEVIDEIAALALRYLEGRGPLFERRIAAARARDGHGDLLADDVFCLPDGPRVLDCLEFDDQLRFSDTLADVAFLAMDLERLGRIDLARRFLDCYSHESADRWPASLEDLYVAYRAVVRAKVAFLRAADPEDGDDGAAAAAHDLLELARRHLRRGRVRLVLVGGPPAAGKSTLARAIGERLGWPVLHSDEVRKELAGLDPRTRGGAPLGRGIYTDEWTDRTYGRMVQRAGELLSQGTSVVLDASWAEATRRADTRRVAGATASEVVEVRCAAPESVRRDRAARRLREGTDASDATPELAVVLASRFAPWPTAHEIDGTAPVGVLTERVARLIER